MMEIINFQDGDEMLKNLIKLLLERKEAQKQWKYCSNRKDETMLHRKYHNYTVF